MSFFNLFSKKEKKEALDAGLEKTKTGFWNKVARAVAGKSKVDEEVLDNLEDVLITSDVGVGTTLEIIKRLEERVARDKYVGIAELRSILKDEVISLMTNVKTEAEWQEAQPADGSPRVIMVVGVNGVGKTTTIGKLAHLMKAQGQKVVLGAADTFRAAAIEQLDIWGERIGCPVIKQKMGADPAGVAFDAVQSAKASGADVVIIDTAGRLHIDEALMEELKAVKEAAHPDETLLVVDSMTGQDAVNVASAFDSQLGVDGIILTKLDGDSRGGAALSVKAVTGKPIKFAGVGEKIEDLEPFYPDRMASRILGMGDILSLIEKASTGMDEQKANKMLDKLRRSEMDFNDLLEQMDELKKMGPLSGVLNMIPGAAGKVSEEDAERSEKEMARSRAIIYSMTPAERAKPSLIDPKRKRRIAAGSGTRVEDVNRLLRQLEQSRKLMKMMSGKGGKKGKRMAGFPGGFPGMM